MTMSGYFRCECCGMDEMGSGALCDICRACDCAEEGGDPGCREYILDGARGVYLPQAFVKGFDMTAWNVKAEDADTLIQEGPDGEHYWEAWDAVLDDAHLTDEKGRTWRLEQDGDLFAYCDHVPFNPSLHTDEETESEET